jgi:hypothetical protein
MNWKNCVEQSADIASVKSRNEKEISFISCGSLRTVDPIEDFTDFTSGLAGKS